jgi:hypothetical protein
VIRTQSSTSMDIYECTRWNSRLGKARHCRGNALLHVAVQEVKAAMPLLTDERIDVARANNFLFVTSEDAVVLSSRKSNEHEQTSTIL